MTDPHPVRRPRLELIALDTDRDRQQRHLAIFFSALPVDPTIQRLADYRHAVVMEDHQTARQIIDELIDQDQEARR